MLTRTSKLAGGNRETGFSRGIEVIVDYLKGKYVAMVPHVMHCHHVLSFSLHPHFDNATLHNVGTRK